MRPPGRLVVCAACSRRVREDDAERLGWRYRVEGAELRPVCALCVLRELDAGHGQTAAPDQLNP